MLKERVYAYFIDGDYNCAESLLHAANDEYNLALSPDSYRLIASFGGGMGGGHACGALCAAQAVLGRLCVTDRAHQTEGFGPTCAALYQAFEQDLGSAECTVLKQKYRNDEMRCLKTVELAADTLERFLRQHKLVKT